MSHTPGPWVIQRYSNYEGFSIWAPGSVCITERFASVTDLAIPHEANARLIAAAPELLLACKLMVEWEESYRTINNLGTIPPSPFQIAIATIAQVEERQ